MIIKFFRNMVEMSNLNLKRNIGHLVKESSKLNYANTKWIDDSQKRFDDSKFKSFKLDFRN